MMKHSIVRGIISAGVLSLAFGCIPSGPLRPEAFSTVRIDHNASTFLTIVGYDHTSAWNKPQLDDGGLVYEGALPGATSVAHQRGTLPREFFVFAHSPDVSGTVPSREVAQFQYGALPPRILNALGALETVSLTVPYPVHAARLIDHGQCRVTVPWLFETGSPLVPTGIFRDLHGRITDSPLLRSRPCAGCSLAIRAFRYAPTFRKAQSSFASANDDGFHFRLTLNLTVPSDQQPHTMVAYARYQVAVDAFNGIRIVAMDTDVSSDFALTPAILAAATQVLKDVVPAEVLQDMSIDTQEPCDSSVCCNQIGDDGLSPGERRLRVEISDRLLAMGASPLEADFQSRSLANGTTFVLGGGTCRLHPRLRRINVLPDRLEMVTANQAEPADNKFTRIYSIFRLPNGARGACNLFAGLGPFASRESALYAGGL